MKLTDSVTKIKGIGETMISFLASLAQKAQQSQILCIELPTCEAKGFYYKLGFEKPFKDSILMLLPEEKVDLLIKRNEQRNGSKINFEVGKNGK